MNNVEYWEEQAQKQVSPSNIKVKSGKIAYLLREILSLPLDGKQVVEVGCGSAFIGYILSLIFPRMTYTGFEIAPSYLNNPLPVEIKEGRITDLPYPDNSADYVFLLDVLEHIEPKERVDAYTEINRILSPGGIIIINNPVSTSKHNEQFENILETWELASMCKYIYEGQIMSWQTLILNNSICSSNFVLIRKGKKLESPSP